MLKLVEEGLPTAPLEGGGDLRAVIHEARKAWPPWARLPFEQRLALLRRLSSSLWDNLDVMAASLVQETGRPWWLALLEARAACRLTEEILDQLEEIDSSILYWPLSGSRDGLSPLGVWLISTDVTCGLFLNAVLCCAALLGGNSVIMSPERHLMRTSAHLCSLTGKVGLPPGVCSLLSGRWTEEETVAITSAEASPDGILVSGSPGRLRRLLPKGLDPLSVRFRPMDMGGSCVLIWGASDAERAAREVFLWAFAHGGQIPGSPRFVLCGSDQMETVWGTMVEEMERLRITGPMDEDAVVGEVQDAELMKDAHSWREKALACGTLRTLRVHESEERQFLPAVWWGPTGSALMKDEIPMGCLVLCEVGDLGSAFMIIRQRDEPFLGIYCDAISELHQPQIGPGFRGIFVNGFPDPFGMALAGEGTIHRDGLSLVVPFMRLQEYFFTAPRGNRGSSGWAR
jgi:succinylglutamic semialdehyde dehydrogenase